MKKKVKAPVRIDFSGGTTDISPFKDKYGGCVLNAAIDKYVVGEIKGDSKSVSLEYSGNIPTSSGLGTSGVMNLVWLALVNKEKDKKKLSEIVYLIEQSQGLVGGKQDQYAAAFGGINLMEFNKDKVKVIPLKLSKKIIKKLERKLILVYTGKPHFSGNTNSKAIENLKKGKNTKNLLRLKQIAYEMKKVLEKGDLDKFADLMNEETKERDKLHSITVNPHLDKFIAKGKKNGAIASKVCGSGGGGSVLFFGDKKRLKKKFGKKCIDFKFDFKGLRFL